MHRLVLAALMAVITPASQPRGAASAGADSTALLAAYEQYRQAWLHNDSAAALGRISDDIHILISGIPEIVGKHATRKLFLDEMAHYRHTALTLDHHDVIVIGDHADRKSTRLNSSHSQISYAVFCLKKKKKKRVIVVTQSIR